MIVGKTTKIFVSMVAKTLSNQVPDVQEETIANRTMSYQTIAIILFQ